MLRPNHFSVKHLWSPSLPGDTAGPGAAAVNRTDKRLLSENAGDRESRENTAARNSFKEK